ncbi:nitroreductase family deazaflavin-dependent oxidoreductase [Jatrophihabitans sp.]|uniref:nitroreductase family deazaflavin-dependent oxidoreductase n=1 Tax=Jatrophihabitans sp. TaxID=1932789 RepID=UPI0030C7099F|nr:nitroreductase [Jatrophihabitans sp.]
MVEHRYLAPGWFTRNVFNRLVQWLTKLGISVMGSRELSVRGRVSGEWRTTPVNLLTVEGDSYLVSPRGNTQWVRNLRIAGNGRLRVGRRTEEFTAQELSDEAKAVVLREYLRRWKWEVGAFFDGLSADSSDADLAAAAPGFPAFRVLLRPPS